jgi:predicted DNA-binding protein
MLGVLYTALYMAATRTQIYLTKKQRQQLDARRKREGKTLAAVVRDAVDAYMAPDKTSASDIQAVLDRTFGSIPDLEVPSRDEWEERAKRLGY